MMNLRKTHVSGFAHEPQGDLVKLFDILHVDRFDGRRGVDSRVRFEDTCTRTAALARRRVVSRLVDSQNEPLDSDTLLCTPIHSRLRERHLASLFAGGIYGPFALLDDGRPCG